MESLEPILKQCDKNGDYYSILSQSCKLSIHDGQATIHVDRYGYLVDRLNEKKENLLIVIKNAYQNVTSVNVLLDSDVFEAERKAQREAQEAREREWQAIRERQERESRIDLSHIPRNTQNTHRFETFKVVDGNSEALKAARDYVVADIDDVPNFHHFLTLTGDRGTGKTHLAIAIGWHLLLNADLTVIYFQTQRLLDSMIATFNSNNKNETAQKIIKSCEEVGLLVLDDIGANHSTLWAMAELDALIDYRYINLLDTVFTTNEMTKMSKNIEWKRIVSRLNEGITVNLNIPDYRVLKAIQREKKSRVVPK